MNSVVYCYLQEKDRPMNMVGEPFWLMINWNHTQEKKTFKHPYLELKFTHMTKHTGTHIHPSWWIPVQLPIKNTAIDTLSPFQKHRPGYSFLKNDTLNQCSRFNPLYHMSLKANNLVVHYIQYSLILIYCILASV